MGLISKRIFLDSCIAIYLIEEHEIFAQKIEDLIASISPATLVISDLTVMECLIGPTRSGNRLIEEKFLNWFDDITVLALNRTIFIDAARLRADYPALKTPDAIHVATALHYNCDEFWTNDLRLNIDTSIIKSIL